MDRDQLPGRIREFQETTAEIERGLAEARERRGSQRQALQTLEGGRSAPDLADELRGVEASLQRHAGRYVRLRLSRLLLHREMERHRTAHQGPLLERARAIFSRITCGAFTSLEPDYDEADRPQLVAVRAGGERLRVEGMSDGTREQLYLALRLASLERHVGAGEPIPLVVDDLLLRSDEDRSRAILEVLADLSAKTQVLFFTHHRRYVEVATGLGRRASVFVQTLDARHSAPAVG